MYKVFELNKCVFDRDYDKDGVDNNHDNAIYNYNPTQFDYDKDGVGNVLDNDID
jgi:hypothetical protein